MDAPVIPTGYEFEDFVVNSTERVILKDGENIEVSSKTFDVLIALVEKYGETVTKDELLETVWSGSFVEEKNITVHISKLRKLLGANKSRPFIKTVTGKGYQFVTPVQFTNKVFPDNKATGLNGQAAFQTKDKPSLNSIAVLPLINENGDKDIEYLADGLTAGLINSLSYLSDFRVLARDTVFYFKDKDLAVLDIGKKLGVSTVLSGRIRVLKDNIIIGVELINVADGAHIWGTQINETFSDIFEMQEKLTLTISEKLKKESSETIINSLPQTLIQNAESYRLYLSGKYFLEKRTFDDIEKAIECFYQSIKYDATNILACIGLTESYFYLFIDDYKTYDETVPILDKLIQKATEIDKEIPELYVIKGRIEKYVKWNIKQAEKFYLQAIELNPNFAEAHQLYAYLLLMCGRFPEAMVKMSEVETLSPFSMLNNKNVTRLYFLMGEFEKALTKLDEVFSENSNDFVGHTLLGAVLAEMGDFDNSIKAYQKTLDMQFHYENFAMKGYVSAIAGRVDEAERIIKILDDESEKSTIPALYKGLIYSALGEINKTFECLEESYRTHETDLIALKVDPRWKSIKHDSRFLDLIHRLGL